MSTRSPAIVKPPKPEALRNPDRHYVTALENATEVVEHINWTHARGYETYCWTLPPSRNTWPTKHVDRPAPSPGCACSDCHRPRCCNAWSEPVQVFTGEIVAWICPVCLEPSA